MTLKIDRKRLQHIVSLSDASNGVSQKAQERASDLRRLISNGENRLARLGRSGFGDSDEAEKLRKELGELKAELPDACAKHDRADALRTPTARLAANCTDYAASRGVEL